MTESAPSLLDALRADPLDEEGVASMLRDARTLSEKTESLRQAREDRLRDLGYEAPSDEQRKQTLAQNIALRDWPTT